MVNKAEKLKAKQKLKEILGETPKIYGIVLSVANMSRRIKTIVVSDGRVIPVDQYINIIFGRSTEKDGVRMQVCGIDALKHLTDWLSDELEICIKYEWVA